MGHPLMVISRDREALEPVGSKSQPGETERPNRQLQAPQGEELTLQVPALQVPRQPRQKREPKWAAPNTLRTGQPWHAGYKLCVQWSCTNGPHPSTGRMSRAHPPQADGTGSAQKGNTRPGLGQPLVTRTPTGSPALNHWPTVAYVGLGQVCGHSTLWTWDTHRDSL